MIHNEDCLDTMARMDPGSVDLIVTSPPYNLRNTTGGSFSSSPKSRWKNAALKEGYDNHDDNMPHAEYVAWQRRCLDAMMRVLADDGAIFYNHKWRVQGGLIQDRADIMEGFPVRQIIIWARPGGHNFTDAFFLPTYEVIYLVAKPAFRLKRGTCGMGDLWQIKTEQNSKHPAPFPVEIPLRCIKATNAGVIYDPFMGSGTTAMAAKALGRKWIGSEISAKYCKMAEERLRQEVL